mmetsp:Transcript_126513/g.307475  ORF Transcript_126513/g.307475 Transcript_126513/m.307475 type:complete len:236 (+) Transcript_126513:57-764(+)
MKLNLANPATGAMKVLDVDDEKVLVNFYDKRIAQEVDGAVMGDEFKGYIFKIAGGNDKQGFPMMQGVLTAGRVRLLMQKGFCYYRPRRDGERKRKSVRGCIVGADLAVLNLVLVKQGDADVPGLTDAESAQPARLGPKRANNIRKLFNLSKEDNVKEYVIGREVTQKNGKTTTKRPKIQRLVTKTVLARKRLRIAAKQAQRQKSLAEAAAYEKLRQKRIQERKDRRSSRKSSRKE